MSLEQMADSIGEAASRRSFLKRVGGVALGAMLTAMGLAQEASATYDYKCCKLCFLPGGSCSGTGCSWCWTCCSKTSPYTKWRCCEKYFAGYACTGACDHVKCSYVQNLGTCPPPLAPA